MFADDIALVSEMVAKYGPAQPLYVECGGLERPTIADYTKTIEAMKTAKTREEIRAAQMCRYLNVERPLEAILPGYLLEDPATGGVPIERLHEKYERTIGTAVLLSVLEHVEEPWDVPSYLIDAVKPGGLIIVSVPWCFPTHPSPKDCYRFSPDGLRAIFKWAGVEILECDWRLKIAADEGVLELWTMKPQAIESCYLVAKCL